MKISVIIPVYNCEASIEESIRSVQRQTIREIEIICVDDGSTDRSAKLILEIQKKDSRIQLYRQDNKGAGAARNMGMCHAKGEFIAFLDADDYYLDADALETMFSACKERKVSVCGTEIRILRGERLVRGTEHDEVMKASEAEAVLRYQDFQFDYGYMGFLFEKRVITGNQLQFPSYRRFQDPVFFVRAMYVAERFCFMNKALYAYRAPNVAGRFRKESTTDLLRGLSDNLKFAADHQLHKLFRRTVMRLEEEYSDIIIEHLSVDSIALLLEINNLVQIYSKNTEYVIAPLCKIMENVNELQKLQTQRLISEVVQSKNIFPYGAGKACEDFLKYLEKHHLINKVESILVTDTNDNPDSLLGIPIIGLNHYQPKNEDLVVVTVAENRQKEVIDGLKKRQIEAFEVIRSGFYQQ